MAKVVPPHQWAKAKKCIFCGKPGLTHTHIWPDWLNRKFPGASRQTIDVEVDHEAPGKTKRQTTTKIKQGNLFTQAPFLACEPCNSGWMKKFEDVELFIHPILDGVGETHLSSQQNVMLCGWVMLITILAEYTLKCENAISIRERLYLRNHKRPPENWAIFAARSAGPHWSKFWVHQVWQFSSVSDAYTRRISFETPVQPNSQLTTMGMGQLFIHLFSSPHWGTVSEFEAAAKARGLVQLWPPPRRFWPLPQRRTKLPAELTLSDDEADIVAYAFAERINIMFGASRPLPYVGP